ncbi:MAG: SDR family NAD(P)-dependent oxidoreductase [Bacteroidia bacterium]|nr:SDR family NAD(P)-dependent oxidoreductase [Bacteroidia bacterium]MDW8134389.1 SDR family NAD(P)-dependent oxidoreductase [Bacteroidia bacterium]
MPKALLTGAAGGIGRATALLLWKKGFDLILTDKCEISLKAAFPDLPSGSVREVLDVTDPQAWQGIANRYTDPDILIQLAGVMRAGTFIKQSPEEWEWHVKINLNGIAYGAQTFGRIFAERGKGHIINVASLAGVAPIPGITAYTATKFAVRGLSLALDAELRPYGVAVSVVCPGPVRTSLILNELPKPESLYTLAMGGLLEPAVVAKSIWKAIRTRRREILLPLHKAIAAKFLSLFPELQGLAKLLAHPGATRRRQKYLKNLEGQEPLLAS